MLLKSYKNAFLKRKVLSLCLKRDTEELFLMSEGRVFQSVGAAKGKPPREKLSRVSLPE